VTDAGEPSRAPVQRPTFGAWMGSMWAYTLLRFGLFVLLWLIFVVAGLGGLIAAVIAAVVSIPLSYVLLARPRAKFAATIEQRVEAARAERAALDQQLSGEDGDLSGS
jgi:glycerol-3-phosphate acyltransferase PlsY